MTKPDQNRLFQALDATWPPARMFDKDGWRLRVGEGGGQRVSAATAITSDARIGDAERAMEDLGQRPLFMIRHNDDALDSRLDDRGYDIVDPVVLYLVSPRDIARLPPPSLAVTAWPPLAIQRDLWKKAGVSEARIAIMHRACEPKTTFLCRTKDTPAGMVFVAVDGDIAMLHALEVAPDQQRQGLGELAVRAVADWAVKNGANWLTLAVTKANAAANGLYRKLTMEPAASYQYRRAPEPQA